MRAGIVIIEISFNIEKDKSRFPIPNYDVIRVTGRDFFDDELVEGRLQQRGKSRGVSRYEPHRAKGRTTQDVIKYKNREKRIGSHSETQRVQVRFSRRGADSIKPVQIEIHRDASARDDHLFKSSGFSARVLFSGLCYRISRAVDEKQKQWQREITQHFPDPSNLRLFGKLV